MRRLVRLGQLPPGPFRSSLSSRPAEGGDFAIVSLTEGSAQSTLNLVEQPQPLSVPLGRADLCTHRSEARKNRRQGAERNRH